MKIKPLYLLIVLFIFIQQVFSQSEVDALRYSKSQTFGTTRMMGMGGAFTALGADVSSVAINPGGIAAFRGSDVSVTPLLCFTDVSAKFNNQLTSDIKYSFALSNLGFVKTWILDDDNSNSTWKSVHFGFTYNKTNDFNRNILANNLSASGSFLDQYVVMANNGQVNNLLKTVDLIYLNQDSTAYLSDYSNTSYGQRQQLILQTEGSAGEFNFAFGGNFNNVLMAGVSMSFHNVHYKENYTFTEEDPDGLIPNLEYFNVHKPFTTNGDGFSMKFGLIARPTEWLRAGLAYQSPVFYSFTDKYGDNAESAIEYENGIFTNKARETKSEFDWELTSPQVVRLGIGFIIMKTAILSLDYEWIDYPKARMQSDDYNFITENQAITDTYKGNGNVKTGAEYRYGPFAFRGGLGINGNPYTSGHDNSNAKNWQYSLGFGIKDKNVSVDFSWVKQNFNEKYFAYGSAESMVKLEGETNLLSATFSMRF